jgi:hypothetical protein
LRNVKDGSEFPRLAVFPGMKNPEYDNFSRTDFIADFLRKEKRVQKKRHG